MLCNQRAQPSNVSPLDSICNPLTLTSNQYHRAVVWSNSIFNPTSVPSGGTAIPAGNFVSFDSNILPNGTVTLISGFCGFPNVNIGGIVLTNGFFTVPLTGNYIIFGNITFQSVSGVTQSDLREISLYKIDFSTKEILPIVTNSKIPVSGSNTSLNIVGMDNLKGRDRVFMAVRQKNSLGQILDTVPGSGRITISLIR